MKKILIIGMVFAFSVSFDVGKASNVITTEKQHTIENEIMGTSYLSTNSGLIAVIDNVVELQVRDLDNLVAVVDEPFNMDLNLYSIVDYKPKGHLKNKVNNFHLFYRVKRC